MFHLLLASRESFYFDRVESIYTLLGMDTIDVLQCSLKIRQFKYEK